MLFEVAKRWYNSSYAFPWYILQEIFFLTVGLSAQVFFTEISSKTSGIMMSNSFMKSQYVCAIEILKLDMPLFCLGFVSLILRAGWECGEVAGRCRKVGAVLKQQWVPPRTRQANSSVSWGWPGPGRVISIFLEGQYGLPWWLKNLPAV